MKKILVILTFCMFAVSLVAAANGMQAKDTSGPYHDEVVESGGMNGTPEPALMQERREAQLQARNQIMAGDYKVEGKQIKIEERGENKIRLRSQDVSAETELELEEETNGESKLKATLSNGRKANIKVMPDTASETALARLRLKVCAEENNCTIELKEVGQGNQTRAAYEFKAQKQARVLGLFRARMQVQSQIDAETGEVIRTRRPWWSFLATEEDEIEETEEVNSSE